MNTYGRIIAIHSIAHQMNHPKVGWAEMQPEKVWYGEVVCVIKELLKAVNPHEINVKAVAVSSIGPDVVPLDDLLLPLRDGILYGIDTRATQEIEQLEKVLGKDRIFQTCGNKLSSQSTGPKV